MAGIRVTRQLVRFFTDYVEFLYSAAEWSVLATQDPPFPFTYNLQQKSTKGWFWEMKRAQVGGIMNTKVQGTVLSRLRMCINTLSNCIIPERPGRRPRDNSRLRGFWFPRSVCFPIHPRSLLPILLPSQQPVNNSGVTVSSVILLAIAP